MTIQIHDWVPGDTDATCRNCGAIKPAVVFPQTFPSFCAGSPDTREAWRKRAIDVGKDRDAWKQEHENALACWRADLIAVTLARDEALAGEAASVRRAESAEMGCEIAYQREPTQAEGDAHEHHHEQSMGASHPSGECFVPMGGWTGRRCRACDRWVWGGPTACEGCVRREERDDARDCGQDDVCATPPGCQRHWAERCRELVEASNV